MFLLMGLGFLVGVVIHRRSGDLWGYGIIIPAFVLGMLNIFTGQWLNAAFLNAAGVHGTAVIVDSRRTDAMLNNQHIWDYHVVLRTADGEDVTTGFSSLSATIWPIRNAILVPPQGETFVVKYVPGFERNIVIMSDESSYGKRRLLAEAQAPVERARRMLEVSPANPDFMSEYRQTLRGFIDDYGEIANPDLIARYEKDLRDFEKQPRK